MTLTRMIFAIQVTDITNPTRLRVSGDVGTPAPVMMRRRRGDAEPTPVGCVDGSWTMDLADGDYIVEMQVQNWIAGRLDIVAELTPGQTLPIFVDYNLAAWEATALYIDPPESSAADDPKDPWPPPPPPPPRATLAPVSAAWFTAELSAARTRIAEQLLGGGGKCVPASILEALTGL